MWASKLNEENLGLGFSDAPCDEFEEAQMMCSYEYGDWDDEDDS